MRRALLLVLVLLGASLTGCLGGDDETQQNTELQSRAQVSEQAGGIQGVVTDEAVQPVEGAEISLGDTGRSAETAQDGSFAFSNVEPGDYTLQVRAEAFISTEQQVTVTSGEVTQVEVTIAHEPTIEPFSQQLEFKGFVECSVATPVVLVAVCAFPNFLLGGNATNDRFAFNFPIEENPWQMVTEVDWQPNQPLGNSFSVAVEPDGLPNDNKTEFGDDTGEPPIIIPTDRRRFAEVDKNTTLVCDGEKEPQFEQFSAGSEAYCNRNYIEEGGRGQVRVFVANVELAEVPEDVPVVGGAPVGTGFAVQQEYQLFITAFYNTPACEDYSIVEGNRCEQQAEPPAHDPADEVLGGSSNSTNESG